MITSQATLLSSQRSAVDLLSRRLTASVLLVEALGGGLGILCGCRSRQDIMAAK